MQKKIINLKELKIKAKINKIEKTSETLSGRGGLCLFSRYVFQTGIYHLLERLFGYFRKSQKGKSMWEIFKQVFCFLYDGTSRHLTYFDELKSDEGYAGVIEENSKDLVSSHQVKRFFGLFSFVCGRIFRKVLKHLFIWRLKIENPEVIELTLDTMVMDNDEAEKRHGVEPTYKKKKGFQPLQMIWKGRLIDAIFRGGKKHGNYGGTVLNMVTDLVRLIREKYSKSVPIVLRVDSGFFDGVNFSGFNKLDIGFVGSGKIYKSIKEYVKSSSQEQWNKYENDRDGWEYLEFGYRCERWENFYRTFYTRPFYEDNQLLFEFARPDNVIITNIGINKKIFESLSDDRRRKFEGGDYIIRSFHQRGADELPHRGFKDFGFEQLPFKRFNANMAFYYCMVISFFLFETFKQDVLSEVIPVVSYATTVRRKALDFAVKIVRTGRKIILKVTEPVLNNLKIFLLWEKCQNPPPI